MKQVRATIISNKQIVGAFERGGWGISKAEARNTLGGWLLWLKCSGIAEDAKPGQYIMVRCGDYTLPRPFSIHGVRKNSIALFYAVLEDGKGTTWLSQCKKGDTVELFGPLGNGYAISPTSHNLLLVAGGRGIAPLLFLASRASRRGHVVTLIRGASGEPKPSGKDNLSQHYPEASLPQGIETKTVTTFDHGKKGLATEIVPEYADWADQVFACGPMAMYRTMARMPELMNKPTQVSLEVVMGCGRGVCYGCTINTRHGLKEVCKDGPVFNLDDILWDELIA